MKIRRHNHLVIIFISVVVVSSPLNIFNLTGNSTDNSVEIINYQEVLNDQDTPSLQDGRFIE